MHELLIDFRHNMKIYDSQACKKEEAEGRKGENMSKLFALLLLLFGGIALKKLFNQILPISIERC